MWQEKMRQLTNSSSVRGVSIDYRPELDGIRSIAILGVVFTHGGLLDQGGWGVDLFFLLSGYLVTCILTKNFQLNHSIRIFYVRRFSRLAPLSILYVFLALIVAMILERPYSWTLFFSALFNYRNFFEFDTDPWVHYWSLSAEEQFYCIWPVIFLIFFKLGWKKLLAVSSIATFIALQIFSSFFQFANPRTNFVFEHVLVRPSIILLGCGIALLETMLKKEIKLCFNYTLFFLGLFLLLLSSATESISWVLGLLMCTASLLIPEKGKLTIITKVLSLPPFPQIGLISYSIYIWHFMALGAATYISSDYVIPKILLSVFLVLASGLISFICFEKPCQRFLVRKFT